MTREPPTPPTAPGVTPPDLSADGWSWRSTIDPNRADEVRELYTSVGFEVEMRSAAPAMFSEQCTACAADCENKILVYTRKPGDPNE